MTRLSARADAGYRRRAMASNRRKVAASEPGHLHDAATCKDQLENRSVACVGHLTYAPKPSSPARSGPTRRGQGAAMRISENRNGCRLKSKQGRWALGYAEVPRPASARFRSAICPAW